MKNKMNKKGMTLVEVIVAMAIFGVITTGFMMSASYSLKAQAKAKIRLSETNEQTTNLEDYQGVVDFAAADVAQLETGSNKWSMVYEFPTGDTITNDNLHGYTSKSNDEVLKLGFFSADDKLDLAAGEYWVTLFNYSSDDMIVNITCSPGFVFFDNEKHIANSIDTLSGLGIVKDGGAVKFGIKDLGGGDLTQAFTVKKTIDDSVIGGGALNVNNYSDADRYAYTYYNGSAFLNAEAFDEWYVPAEEGE